MAESTSRSPRAARPPQTSPDNPQVPRPRLVDPTAPPPAFPDPIPGILPFGSISTLSGETGAGKNALVSEWVARFQTGRTICHHPTNAPTAIGMIAGDRRWRTAKTWLDVAGCAPIQHVSLRDDPTFKWAKLRDWRTTPQVFAEVLQQLALPPGGLLIVDPLALFLPGKVNDYKDMAIGLAMLDQVLHPLQLTTLGIFHQSKQSADQSKGYSRPQDRILGSAAQIGFSDTSMFLMTPSELAIDYYGFGWVPHNAPAETFEFTRARTGLFVPYKGMLDESDEAQYDRPTQVLQQLVPDDTDGIDRQELVAKIVEQFGVSPATAYRDIDTLKKRRQVEVFAGRVIRRKPS